MRNRTQRREATTHTQTIVSTQKHQGEVKLQNIKDKNLQNKLSFGSLTEL